MRDDENCDSAMDLETLRGAVENQIDSYRYEVPVSSVGEALAPEQIEVELATMRAALIAPYWADVELRDTFEQVAKDEPACRRCVVVADDGHGNYVAFDPIENEFLLAVKVENNLLSIGVRGDAVGCFMAR